MLLVYRVREHFICGDLSDFNVHHNEEDYQIS